MQQFEIRSQLGVDHQRVPQNQAIHPGPVPVVDGKRSDIQSHSLAGRNNTNIVNHRTKFPDCLQAGAGIEQFQPFFQHGRCQLHNQLHKLRSPPVIDALHSPEMFGEVALRNEISESRLQEQRRHVIQQEAGLCQIGAKPRLISNYPSCWTSYYLCKRYEDFDPVIERARCGTCSFRWGSKFGRIDSSKRQRQVFDEAAAFGICCGLTIPVADRRGRVAAMTFAADEPDPTFLRVAGRYGQVLQLMALDGSLAGASHREIATALLGEQRVQSDWTDPGDHLLDRIRRTVRRGHMLMNRGYRDFLV